MTKSKLVEERLEEILKEYYDPLSGGLDDRDIKLIKQACWIRL